MNTANTSKNVFVASYPNRGVTFIKGDGVYLFDQNGEKYLDLGSNYGVNIFGYNHPAITKALHQQLDKLVNLHGSFNSTVRSQAAEKLLEVTGGKLSKIFFSNSGAESTEAALKFAKVATLIMVRLLELYPQQQEISIGIHFCLFSGILLM